MKTHHSRRAHGFTLVELLVVIAIIAVLAGAGFAAGNAAMNKAKRTTSLSTVVALEGAVNNFYSDYGAMPKEMTTDETIETEGDLDVLKVLLGLEGATGTVLNTRSTKYLSVKEGKARKNGLIYSTSGTNIEGLYDPWGGKYYVILDGDYDETVIPEPAAGGGKQLNGRRCAAWSNGADGVSGVGGQVGDDVKSW